MRRFRWWLARRIAPTSIMFDAFPSQDGIFVYVREDGVIAAYKPDKFRIRSRNVLNPRIFGADDISYFGDTHVRRTTFAGTLTR